MNEEIIKLIKDNLSYDAHCIYTCDKCGNSPKKYWIDHKTSLASIIAEKLGLRKDDSVYRVIEDISIESMGDVNADAKKIAKVINAEVCNINK